MVVNVERINFNIQLISSNLGFCGARFGTTRQGKLTFKMCLDISRMSKAPKSRRGNVKPFFSSFVIVVFF